MRQRLLAIVPMLFAGCAPFAPGPPEWVGYRCDGGREFAVAFHPAGSAATIEIERMRFALQREPAPGPGERYGCSVLTLWREATSARVEMQGADLYANCRPKD